MPRPRKPNHNHRELPVFDKDFADILRHLQAVARTDGHEEAHRHAANIIANLVSNRRPRHPSGQRAARVPSFGEPLDAENLEPVVFAIFALVQHERARTRRPNNKLDFAEDLLRRHYPSINERLDQWCSQKGIK